MLFNDLTWLFRHPISCRKKSVYPLDSRSPIGVGDKFRGNDGSIQSRVILVPPQVRDKLRRGSREVKPSGHSKTELLNSLYLDIQEIVEGAKGVGDDLITSGIILPLPIHNKLVLVPSRGKSNNLVPPPVVVPFHWVLLAVPTVKVPY